MCNGRYTTKLQQQWRLAPLSTGNKFGVLDIRNFRYISIMARLIKEKSVLVVNVWCDG